LAVLPRSALLGESGRRPFVPTGRGVDTLDAGRVRLIEGAQEGFVELEGSPDVVLEIVKVAVLLRRIPKTLLDLYWQARNLKSIGLVDATRRKPQFTIYHSAARGFVAARKQNGWLTSPHLWFRLPTHCAKTAAATPISHVAVAP